MKFIGFIFTLIIISSCQTTVDNEKLYYLSHNYESYTSACIDTIQTIQTAEVIDRVHHITYKMIRPDRIDSITYILKEDTIFQPKYLWKNDIDSDSEFVLTDMKEFSVNFKQYRVYKYALNPNAIDGCVTHFWTPELGVFLVRSTSWRKMRVMYSTNSNKNDEITSLCRLIWQYPEFYFGCSERIHLIPDFIYNEFNDWYLKEKLKF